MKRIQIVGAAAVLLAVGCASPGSGTQSSAGSNNGGLPAWFFDPGSVYPPETYIVGIGSGDTRSDAEDEALGALAQVFSVEINVDRRTEERYRDIVSGGSTLSEQEQILAQRTDIRAAQTLLNVQFDDVAIDDRGVVHVIAVLERVPTGRVYADIVSANAERIVDLRQVGTNDADPVRRFAFLSAAEVVATNNERLQQQMRIIAPNMLASMTLGYEYAEIQRLRADAVQQLDVAIQIDGDQDGRVASAVAQALSSERFPISDGAGFLQADGTVRIQPPDESGQFTVVRWSLSLSLVDQNGNALVAYDLQDRATGVSAEAALGFVYLDIEEAVRTQFANRVRAFFDGLALGQ